jgi:DNA processing protein
MESLSSYIKISKSSILSGLLSKGFSIEQVMEYASNIQSKKGVSILISEEKAHQELISCEKLGIKIITFQNELYPSDLKDISNPPPLLFAKGNLNLLKKVKFGIVGSRAATMESNVLARKFAEELSEFGFCIVSGFASGVDTSACTGALNYGTIQVLGNGLNIIYPKQNEILYNQVIEKGGLFISEVAPNTPAKPENFPLRNRIISGISKGILLAQASKKNGSSGSLITAKLALSQGKDLFAIPGHPLDINFQGNNDLIKFGNAIFTTTAKDIMDFIGYDLNKKQQIYTFKPKNPDKLFEIKESIEEKIIPDDDIKSAIKSILGTKPVSIDEISASLQINCKEAQIALVEMELLSEIQRHHNGKFSLSLV